MLYFAQKLQDPGIAVRGESMCEVSEPLLDLVRLRMQPNQLAEHR